MKNDGALTLYSSAQPLALCSLEGFPDWARHNRANDNDANDRLPPQPTPFDLNMDGFTAKANLAPGANEKTTQGAITLDKRIFFVPAAGQLVFLDLNNNKLISRPFDLQTALERTGENYFLVLSHPGPNIKGGNTWSYEVKSLAKHNPVQVKIEKGPEGMSIIAGKTIQWKAPTGITGKAAVTLAFTDSKANITRQSFVINLE
jgi:hypothetical protein